MRHRLTVPAFFSALVLVLFLVGCWNPFKPDKNGNGNGGNGGEELLERTTPANVLTNLKIIYGQKDDIVNTVEDAEYWAEVYRELFDPTPEVFKFWFINGQEPETAPDGWWPLDEEVGSFRSILEGRADGTIDDVQLEWTVNPSVPDNRVDEHGQPLHPGWRWIHVPSVLLDLIQGETVWRVSNGLADFYFGADPADSTLWVITEWVDRQ